MSNRVPNIKIGVINSGRLINELNINNLSDVSFGSSLDNDICVNDKNIPDNFILLSFFKGIYYLNILDGMDGQLISSKVVKEFKELRSEPEAVYGNSVTSIPLSADLRIVLNLDSYTILIKVCFIEAIPPDVSREFRGSLLSSGVDTFFLSLLIFFGSIYVLLMFLFYSVKVPDFEDVNDLPENFTRLVMERPTIKEQKIEQKEQRVEKIKVSEHKTQSNKKVLIKQDQKTKPILTKSSTEIVKSAGIIGVIGSKGSGSGNVANLFSTGGFESKLDSAIKSSGSLRVGRSLEEARIKQKNSEAESINVGKLKTVTGSGLVAFSSSDAKAVDIIGDFGLKNMEGSGSISPDLVAKVLARNIGAFQYCYNRALQNNPKLSGELKVRFMIMPNGMVAKGQNSYAGTASRDRNLVSCIDGVFSRMKFPEPKGGEVIVNYPLNFIAQD